MKKKIINGLLFAVALVAATSSFVSCKDYDADNYNELQAKYLSLQDAFDKQVSAMNDYVLKTTFNTKVGEIEGEIGDINAQTGYSAAELAAKGTIKKRLDDLESEYTTLNGKFNDELDPTKVGSLAYQIAQNNIAIATAQGLAERDSAYLRTLLAGWDNGGTLGDMVSEAAGLLTALKSDTAKYNFAFDTLSTYYEKWNEAVKLANEASQFIGANVKVQGKEVTSLQDMANAYDDAIQNLQDQIDALNEEVEKLKELVQKQVTGIEIQATMNPVFGTFSSPVDIQTNVLAAYYGESAVPVFFPAGDGEDADSWVGSTPIVLSSELQAIGANPVQIPAGIIMNEAEGNAGTLYLTVNPSDVVMDGKEFTLRASDNSVSKVALSPLETSTEQLLWGYYRRAENSPNGFYSAKATISKDVAKDVTLSFNMEPVAKDIQGIMQDWSNVTPADIAKVFMAVRDGLTAKVPRLGVQAQWKDANGWKNYVSKYELLAVSLKPVGYDFLSDMDFSPAIVKFQNKITAKEKAIATEVINKIAQMVAINLNLSDFAGGNVVVDVANNKVWIVIPNGAITNGTEVLIAAGSLGGGQPTSDIYLPVTPNDVAGGYKIDISSIFTTVLNTINNELAKVNAASESGITKVLNKVIDIENKVFNKVVSAAKNPGRFIQPALIARSAQLGYFYPSRIFSAPTLVKRGTKILFYPTTLTAEVVAPAYMKYVAVVGAWKSGDINQDRGAAQYNTGGVLNQPFYGSDYNAEKPFEYTVDAPDGTVLEFVYEAVGYNGKVAGKKYYIEVYE